MSSHESSRVLSSAQGWTKLAHTAILSADKIEQFRGIFSRNSPFFSVFLVDGGGKKNSL